MGRMEGKDQGSIKSGFRAWLETVAVSAQPCGPDRLEECMSCRHRPPNSYQAVYKILASSQLCLVLT